MKDKSIIHQSNSSEQKTLGAPGSPVRIEPGIYKIYTALLSLPQKLVYMSLNQNSDLSHNVYLLHDNSETESQWKISLSAQGDLECFLLNQKIFRALQAKDGDVIAGIIPASSENPGLGWFMKDAGKETGIALFYLENRHTGNLATVKDNSTDDNTNIIESPFSGRTSQKFILVKLENSEAPVKLHSQIKATDERTPE